MDNDWFVARPLANQKKENSEADRATNMSPLANQEEEDSDDDWFVESPLANQKKEESEADRAVATDKGTRADKRRGKKRKNDDY